MAIFTCRNCFVLSAVLVIVIAIGMAWQRTYKFEVKVTVAAKVDDVFKLMSDPYVSKKFHPLV